MRIRLKELREEKRCSQSKLGKISGVARSYISDIEAGIYKNPSATVICKLCKALGCTPNDLIDCEGEEIRYDTRAIKKRKTRKGAGGGSSKDHGG